MPLAVRTLFTTGPGPDSGGSKPGQNGWVHMPEKSGMDAALGAALRAGGAAACPKAGVKANAANVTDRRKSRRCIFNSR